MNMIIEGPTRKIMFNVFKYLSERKIALFMNPLKNCCYIDRSKFNIWRIFTEAKKSEESSFSTQKSKQIWSGYN